MGYRGLPFFTISLGLIGFFCSGFSPGSQISSLSSTQGGNPAHLPIQFNEGQLWLKNSSAPEKWALKYDPIENQILLKFPGKNLENLENSPLFGQLSQKNPHFQKGEIESKHTDTLKITLRQGSTFFLEEPSPNLPHWVLKFISQNSYPEFPEKEEEVQNPEEVEKPKELDKPQVKTPPLAKPPPSKEKVRVVKKGILPGLTHYHIFKNQGGNPLQMHVLKINPAKYQVRIVDPKESPYSKRATLSQMVEHHQAIAGINGMYFSDNGEILGLLKVADRIITSPVYNRATVGINSEEKLFFGYPRFNGTLQSPAFPEKKVFSGINHRRNEHQIMVYSSDFGEKTPLQISGKEFVIQNGVVSKIGNGNLPIPENGFVLSVGPDRLEEVRTLQVGSPLSYQCHLNASWQNLSTAFSAGPLLLYNGTVINAGEFENFKPDFINNRHPRSAIGITRNGAVVLALADGRQPGVSMGLSLKEFSEILKKIGVYHALNLDGGGSSALYIKDEVVNNPSGGTERRIANAIMVYPKPIETTPPLLTMNPEP